MATDNSYQAIILGDPTSTFVLSKKMIKDIFSSHPKIQSEGNRNRWMFSINENNSKYSLVLGANSKHDITEQLNNWNIIPELGNSKSHLSFVRLQRFLLSEMQMQANYQPIMLKTLLENGGRASRGQIAQEIKEFNSDKEREDFRYVPVYEVLEKHKIVRKENDQFVMDISKITGEEKDQLIALCKWKIPNSPLNLEELIEAFDRNMNLFDPDGYDPSGRKQEHEMFVTRFPLENIPQMQIDEYVAGKLDPQTGRANRSTFCYLLEFGLPSFGGIGGRSANKFGIYYSNSAHAYVYDKKYPSPEEAFDHIKNEINTLLTAAKQFHSDKDWKKFSSSVEEGDYDLFRNVRSKIVTVYFPDEFLNFHIPDLIDEALLAFDAKKMNLDSLYLKEERLLQLKNYHHIMRRWNNGQFSHFIWRAIIKRDNKMDDNFITDAEMETTEINEQPRIFVTGYSKANLVHSIEKSVLGWRSQSQLLSKGDYVYVYDKSSHMLQAAFLIL